MTWTLTAFNMWNILRNEGLFKYVQEITIINRTIGIQLILMVKDWRQA